MDTLSEIPGMVSAGPKENHTLRVPLIHKKTTELHYIHRVATASSAQYTQTTKKIKRDRWEGGRKTENEAERERNTEKPSLQKSTQANR